MVSIRDVRTIQRATAIRDAMLRQQSENWLEIAYRRSLYGGWEREDKSLAPPHRKAVAFHESAKALFCPECDAYIGQIGSDEDETFRCSKCREDWVLPPRDDEPGDWLLAGPTFSKHFPLTLNPYFEQAMGHMITDRVKNQQKVVTQYFLNNGERLHCLSYEQFLKAGKDATNPFEGPRWKGALFDEPPPRQVWIATKRGLLRWASKYSKPPFAQAYGTILVGGGNQCLWEDTLVWDEGHSEHRRIADIHSPLTVLAWDGEKLVPARAEPHTRKGPDRLLRVNLKSGRSFAATAFHHVLTPCGWSSVGMLSSGTLLRTGLRNISRLYPEWDEVLAIEDEGTDFHYDLWVPEFENFVAAGVIHHNSSKSYTSRSEFCARIIGRRPWDGSLSRHYGRSIIAATPLDCAWMFHDIYQNAWNKGGDNRSIFAMEFSIYDNPALTKKAIQDFAETLSPEEADARIHGRFKHLSGRIFPEFDPDLHVYDSNKFDPLREHYSPESNEASDVPIIMAVDPHYRRPWFMVWVAVMPDGRYFVVDEWPKGKFERMKNSHMGLDDYAAAIREIEGGLPGGEARVLWREFDPNMARTPTTTASRSSTLQQEMRDRGLYFRTDVNDKLHFGHSLLHTLLAMPDPEREPDATNRPSFYVSDTCRNVIFSFENYTWQVDTDQEKAPKDKPKDLGKDGLDCCRYAIARETRWMSWKGRSDWYHAQRNKMLRKKRRL